MKLLLRFFIVGVISLQYFDACRRVAPPPNEQAVNRGSDASGGQNPEAGEYSRGVTVDGRRRSYRLVTPKGLDPKRPAPVIFAFHPGFATSNYFDNYTQLSQRAGEAGFVLVYPEGVGRSWNAGDCCGPAMREGVDDIAFVRAMLDDMTEVVNYDPRRVYATGFSNGAKLVFRLACELSGRFAAIATIGATISVPESQCRPARLPPLLHFHGSKDEFAPYEGGQSAREPAGMQRSVRETIRIWLDRDECAGEPQPVYQKGSARCVNYSACRRRADITVCTIEGMGHQWPGAQAAFPRWLGPESNDISATEMLIKFFVSHPGVD